jgi:hypothetical protein
VASISPAGLATALSPGTTGITAALAGVTSPTDTLTVTTAALQSIAVTPAAPSIAQGQTKQFTATGTYTDGTTADLTPQVTWASANPAVASISPAGLATALSPGTTGITAALAGVASPADPLTVTAAPTVTVTGVAVQWGSQTAVLQTASDGLRLLPAGRATDLPWFNINRIAITLSQSALVNAGDVTVTGMMGGDYGPVTITGSGTSNILIALAKPVSVADRVTVTIGNSQVITFKGRLDILPGDVNDDGAVNTTDGVVVLNNETPAHAYRQFNDLNGDGIVSTADFTLDRPRIGTVLPVLPPQLAAGGEGPGSAAVLTQAELAPVLGAAIARWAAAGLPARDVARLRGVSLQVVDLPAGYLGGTAIGSTTIDLSADAAGHGWFVDTSAASRSAFATAAPAGREDLLTVVMHELGHTLGLNDLSPAVSSTDVMSESLATGVRRLPSTRDVVRVLSTQVDAKKPTATVVRGATVLATAGQNASPPPPAAIPPSAPGLRSGHAVIRSRTTAPASTNHGPAKMGPQGPRIAFTGLGKSAAGRSRRTSL